MFRGTGDRDANPATPGSLNAELSAKDGVETLLFKAAGVFVFLDAPGLTLLMVAASTNLLPR